MTKIICIEDCVGKYLGKHGHSYNFIKGEKYDLISNVLLVEGNNIHFIYVDNRTLHVNGNHFIKLDEHRNKLIDSLNI